MKDKLLRNVDDEVWQKMKMLGIIKKLTLAETLKLLIDFYEQQAEDLK